MRGVMKRTDSDAAPRDLRMSGGGGGFMTLAAMLWQI